MQSSSALVIPKRRRSISGLPSRVLLILTVFGCAGCGRTEVTRLDDRDRAVQHLVHGDTTAAFNLLRKSNWRKSQDPDMVILLACLYRDRGTIPDRLKSQEVLENARRQFPLNSQIILELGKTYYLQTFYPDAERCFSLALKSPETAGDANYCLAKNYFRKWKRNQQFIDDLDRAADHFKQAGQHGPQPPDQALDHAICCYCRDDFSRAGAICRSVINQDTTFGVPYFLLGVMAFRQDKPEEANRYLEQALDKLPDELRECYLDIAVLLPAEERDEYESASRMEQLNFRRMFWFALDPDPTTPLNERYLEHLGRTFLADVYFSTDRPRLRGWENERGKSLIKFGWPANVQRTLASMTGRSHDGWAEIWTYGEDVDYLELVFVDEFLNGTFAVPRDIAFTNMAQVLTNSPAVSSFEPAVIQIPGRLNAVSFKNSSLSSSVYLAARIDADSLLAALDTNPADCYMRGVLFDSRWDEANRFLDSIPGLNVERPDTLSGQWPHYVKEIQLPFDVYQISCALFDPDVSVRGIFTSTVSTIRYLSDTLTASDILLFCSSPSPARQLSLERGGLKFVPLVEQVIGPGEKLNIYLELYNLIQHRSFSEYEVSYFIFDYPEESQPSLWTWFTRGVTWLLGVETNQDPYVVQTATRKSPERPAQEVMTINIDALRPGRYLLRVSVLDNYSGARTEAATVFIRNQDG
jgi:GWxTD domain-containing protein